MSSKRKTIKVVAGVIYNDQNEILIARRGAHKTMPGKWEFPGGKIEPEECPVQALRREFQEEFNLQLSGFHS